MYSHENVSLHVNLLSIFDVNKKVFQFGCCLKNQFLIQKMTLELYFAKLPVTSRIKKLNLIKLIFYVLLIVIAVDRRLCKINLFNG